MKLFTSARSRVALQSNDRVALIFSPATSSVVVLVLGKPLEDNRARGEAPFGEQDPGALDELRPGLAVRGEGGAIDNRQEPEGLELWDDPLPLGEAFAPQPLRDCQWRLRRGWGLAVVELASAGVSGSAF